MSSFHGIFPATVTPLDDRARFDEAALGPYLSRLLDAGVEGVYVVGTTGEGLEMSMEDRMRVVEATRRRVPAGKRVIVHVGATDVEAACDLARHAAQVGADAVSSLPPLGGFGFAETRSYYERLTAATDLPFFVYYFRERSQAVAGLDQLLALCALPHVAGVKFTDFDLYTLERLRAAGHLVFNGRDEVLAAGLLMGATGGIGSIYNLVPDLFVSLYAAARSGAWAEAQRLQRDVNRLIGVLLRYPLLPAVKAALAWMGHPVGGVRPPRLPLTASEGKSLRADLDGLGLLTFAEAQVV